MSVPARIRTAAEAVPENAMDEPGEVASVLGGVCHLRRMEFSGRRPYHFNEPRGAASGRWEIWMDESQARVVRAERLSVP